jgi:hypothetical protein
LAKEKQAQKVSTMRDNNIIHSLKLKTFPIFLIILAFGCLPAVVTADDSQSPGWLFERINIYRAIQYHKKRLHDSSSEDEKKHARELLLKNYARAIDTSQGPRKEKLLIEAKEDLPEWWVPFFLMAVMKYDKYKDSLRPSDDKQSDILIGEASDLATSAKQKTGIPKKYIPTCNKIIKDYERTKPFTVYGVASNVGENSLTLKGGNRVYSIQSIPAELIQQGSIKEGDIIRVVLKPNMVLTPGSRGSSNLTVRGYNFVSLNQRRAPGYILCGRLIKKVAGSFVVASEHTENIIINISKTDYDFFNVGDTIKCRVFSNTNSYASAGHLSLYEIDPESYRTAGIKNRNPIRIRSNP